MLFHLGWYKRTDDQQSFISGIPYPTDVNPCTDPFGSALFDGKRSETSQWQLMSAPWLRWMSDVPQSTHDVIRIIQNNWATVCQFVSRQAGNGTMLSILKERQRNDNSPQTLQLKYQETRDHKIIYFINSSGTFFNTSALGGHSSVPLNSPWTMCLLDSQSRTTLRVALKSRWLQIQTSALKRVVR